MKAYNWAILGCGKIAKKFSEDLKLLPNAKLYAAASRNLSNAKEFAKKFSEDLKLLPNAKLYAAASRNLSNAKEFAKEMGYEVAYGSYEEMVADPKVDVVYVATPHSHHHKHTLLCLNNKKAVLCEKAFAINRKEAVEMIDCAKKNDTFLMEAFWTMFQPSFLKAMEIIKSEELGKLKIMRSDFAFNGPFDVNNRLYNIKLGGGSLLDIGIYPVFAALTSLGIPEEIKTLTDFSETGSEESISMIFKYKNGEMANLTSSFAVFSQVQTEYWFENGYMILNPKWHTPTNITIKKDDDEPQIIHSGHEPGLGYHYEAAHVMECLDADKIESDKMSWQTSLDLMEILDSVRADAGIVFPDHDKYFKSI